MVNVRAKRIRRAQACSELMNVGEKVLQGLCLLNIQTVEELAQADPTGLYLRLEQITKAHQDPCVWDVFAAIIHEAKTGEGAPWWKWTPIRKESFHHTPLCTHKPIMSR